MVRVTWARAAWSQAERVVLESSAGTVTQFTYDSGVEGLRVRTDKVEAVILPFQGQQIWRLTLDGEPVTMHTMWDEPVPTSVFAQSYGPFLMHCGLTWMGAPGPGERWNHGELPCAVYSSAWVEVDEAAGTLTVGGEYENRMSHGYGYRFTPRLVFRTDAAAVEVSSQIENLRRSPLSWQYLTHVNWVYWPGARLEQDVAMDPDHVSLHPAGSQDEATAAYTASLAESPDRGNALPDHDVVPEYVAVLTPEADADGWAHFAMVRADGVRARVSYDTTELPRAVRWVSRTPDEQAAGFCMPATGHHLGRAQSDAEGLTRTLPGLASTTIRLRMGLER